MGVTFGFSYDLTEQYKSAYRIEITVSLFYRVPFGRRITIYCLNFAECMDLFIAVF